MPSEQNPFDRAYAAIIAAWKGWPALMALVKPLNVIDEQARPFAAKDVFNAGDRPELKLTERRLNFRPFTANALGASFAAEYLIAVASGQPRIPPINLVLWEVGRSLTNAGPYLGLADIVSKWELAGDAALTPYDAPAQRAADWTAVAGVRVDFSLSRAAYLAAQYT